MLLLKYDQQLHASSIACSAIWRLYTSFTAQQAVPSYMASLSSSGRGTSPEKYLSASSYGPLEAK